MIRKEEIGLATLYLGDCREIAAGIGEARACRMAFEITRARAHPDAVFRDVDCKPMEGKK